MRHQRLRGLNVRITWMLFAVVSSGSLIAAGGGAEENATSTNTDNSDKLPVTRPQIHMAFGAANRLRGSAINSAKAGDCVQAILAFRQFVDTEWATADDFNNYAVCLQQEGKRDHSREEYEEGIRRFYHSEKLHQNLGLLLEELANEDFLQGRGGNPEVAALAKKATSHMTFAMRLQLARLWEKHADKIPKQDRIGLGKKTVAIFCRPRNLEGLNEGVWGPSLVLQDGARPEHGEDAVIFMARHLVRLGFNVEVYANMPKGDVGMDKHGVMWRPFYALHAMLPPVWNETHVLWPKMPNEKMPDVFISWQNTEAAHLYNSTVYAARNITPPASYLWLHDVVQTPSELNEWYMRPLHGIILMSRFHAALTPAAVAPCVRISHVCIEQEPPFSVRQLDNHNTRFVYASSPVSGLDVALEQWPHIRKAISAAQKRKTGVGGGREATLEILYSFDAALDARYQGAKWYDAMKRSVARSLEDKTAASLGILHHKKPLSQRQIASKLSSAGFLLYPTSRAEASVAHVARAMLMGCVPISSRTPYSALNETTWPFDLGAAAPAAAGKEPVAQDGKLDMVRIEENPEWVRRWSEAVVAAALEDADKMQAHRDRMVHAARQRFRYAHVADELAEVFRKDIAAGWNGSCGIHTQHGPVPQVIERKDPSERPAQPAAPEAKEKEEFHSDFHTESGRGPANAQQQAQSRSQHTPSKAEL